MTTRRTPPDLHSATKFGIQLAFGCAVSSCGLSILGRIGGLINPQEGEGSILFGLLSGLLYAGLWFCGWIALFGVYAVNLMAWNPKILLDSRVLWTVAVLSYPFIELHLLY